jgi:hypothetical protein
VTKDAAAILAKLDELTSHIDDLNAKVDALTSAKPAEAGETSPGCGAYAVADDRERNGFVSDVRVLTLDEAMALDLDPKKAPPFLPVIVAEDGTWHRPMTALELAALQSYPLRLRDGSQLAFAGGRTLVLEHIGNSVPPAAARAIADQLLVALLEASMGAFSLQGGSTPVWVVPATLQAGGGA